jgi:hypothetical protein
VTDEELVDSVLKHWPRCQELVRAALHAVKAELMTGGIEDDAAFSIAHLAMQRELFLCVTILNVIENKRDGIETDDDGVMDWIEKAYDEWIEEDHA